VDVRPDWRQTAWRKALNGAIRERLHAKRCIPPAAYERAAFSMFSDGQNWLNYQVEPQLSQLSDDCRHSSTCDRYAHRDD